MQPNPRTPGIPHVGPWNPLTGPPTIPATAAEFQADDAQAETESEPSHGHTRIRVRGELDIETVHVLTDALHTAQRAVVVDLGHVTFADTALLHALLDALPDHELLLAGPLPAQIRRLLDATGTRHLFTLSEAA
ncbi:STAS domain-containing protein [Streptomyces sp. NRRL F-2664]|uniref:STAS domain-containing protein n=1 Tax=Streptomyces sp. NRRL F-2664 TaxID=1463842 RepID=UPI00068D3D17|nr:STAS domain-containing protein [Streptomyces sp. NRRL F-2664]